jgi:hypothetical protein
MNVIRIVVRLACLVSVFALLVGQAISCFAQTVLIDFGNDTTYRSLSVLNPDSNGNYWNSIQPGLLIENLVDLDNTATAIDIGWDTPVGFDSFNGPAGATGPGDDKQALRDDNLPFTDIDPIALGNLGGALEGPFDFITGGGPEIPDKRVRLQIQGLNPAQTYTLTFFGSHSFSDDPVTDYTVYSDNTYTTSVAMTSLEVQDPAMFWLHNRDKVATIENLSPQADNILYVEFVGAFGNLGYLNALQIEASAAPQLDGDYNSDGKVDAADYVMWRRDPASFGGPAGYTTWRENFGATGGAGGRAFAVVPEPSSIALAVFTVITSIATSRRRG